jgi:hypothetical protein
MLTATQNVWNRKEMAEKHKRELKISSQKSDNKLLYMSDKKLFLDIALC